MRASYCLSAVGTEVGASGERFVASPRPIDLVHLTRQTFGDKRLETELLRLFARQADEIGRILASEPASPDEALPGRQSARDLLHKLVGSARAVGASQVSALAERLERDRRSGSSPDALRPEDRAQLLDVIAAAEAYIGELLGSA